MMPADPSPPPIRELSRLPFWPALVLVNAADEARAMRAYFEHARGLTPSLPTPRIEVCLLPGSVKPLHPRMYRNADEVPAELLGSSRHPRGDD